LNTGWLLLVIPGLIWGASFLFIAEGLRAIGPNGVAFVRIAVGFLTLSLFPAARTPVARADWSRVAWLGLLWFSFPLVMFPLAEQRVSSALTGMLNGANPLFATIVASYIARRAPSGGVIGGLAVGLTGTEALFPVDDATIHPARVTLNVGTPIRTEALLAQAGGDRRLLMDAVGMAIAELLPESYRGVYEHPGPAEAVAVLHRLRQA